MTRLPLGVCFLLFIQVISGQSTSTKICKHAALTYDSSLAVPLQCASNAFSPIYADFNGDGRTDYFCNELGNSQGDQFSLATPSGVFTNIRDAKTTGWCDTEGMMMSGDFNGDGKDDLLCRYNDGVKYEVSYFSGNGFSSPMKFFSNLFCDPSTKKFLIGDLNGDKADDMVCADMATGQILVHYSGRHHRRRRHYSGKRQKVFPIPEEICIGTNKMLYLGDFNYDRKQDFLCYNPATKKSTISISDRYGHYKMKEIPNLFCATTSPFTISTADVDGDKQSDISCLQGNSDPLKTDELILFSDGHTEFSDHGFTAPNLIDCKMDELAYGDFNGDGLIDVICRSDGMTDPAIIYFATCNQ